MKSTTAIMVIVIIAIAVCAVPVTRSLSSRLPPASSSSYILVGGQNGTWFGPGQAPRLERIDLSTDSVTSLIPAPTEGTVWGGGWNGSQWLVSGWGEDYGPEGSNPYIFLFNGVNQVDGGSLVQYKPESTWHGGDIFAASYNGREWLVSGLGSGYLSSYGSMNHMALAIFNGSNFTDLSGSVPDQQDAILYTNAWNSRYWLVGGGYKTDGVLFSFDGSKFVDLTSSISKAVPTFSSVQAVAWNGNYWLVGGVNFLAKYDGNTFTDLTTDLDALSSGACCSTVNAIAWNGNTWLLGGGLPVAQLGGSTAWIAEYSAAGFTNLTSSISAGMLANSSVLSITSVGGSWIIGGYSNGKGSLYVDTDGAFTNLSRLVSTYTYVDWVGADATPSYSQPLVKGSQLPFSDQRNSQSFEGRITELSMLSRVSVSVTSANSLWRLARFTACTSSAR